MSFKISTSNNVFFDRFLNARYNGVFSIVYIIAIVNIGPIKDYMDGVPIIVLNEQ